MADKRVSGLATAGDERIARVTVASNMDVVRAHRQLIGGAKGRSFDARPNYEPAGGGVVLDRGLKQRDEHIAHHNFVFARDHEKEFVAIDKRGEPAPDATAYLGAPARPRAAKRSM